GGFFMWVQLQRELDKEAMFDLMMKFKVLFLPGEFTFPSEKASFSLRISYNVEDLTILHEGIKRLGLLLRSSTV
ncbi:hypothetical protein CYMTET_50176, partial [Cymbomonas tetramitiformis]